MQLPRFQSRERNGRRPRERAVPTRHEKGTSARALRKQVIQTRHCNWSGADARRKRGVLPSDPNARRNAGTAHSGRNLGGFRPPFAAPKGQPTRLPRFQDRNAARIVRRFTLKAQPMQLPRIQSRERSGQRPRERAVPTRHEKETGARARRKQVIQTRHCNRSGADALRKRGVLPSDPNARRNAGTAHSGRNPGGFRPPFAAPKGQPMRLPRFQDRNTARIVRRFTLEAQPMQLPRFHSRERSGQRPRERAVPTHHGKRTSARARRKRVIQTRHCNRSGADARLKRAVL